MKASAVAARIQRNAPILRMNDGGVTFSGGEALLQHEFVEDVCDRLPDVHKAIETSGYASTEVFLGVVQRLDLVMMDIKLVDAQLHRIMNTIYQMSVEAAEEYGLGYNLVAGANIAGFKKVAEAMMEQGIF